MCSSALVVYAAENRMARYPTDNFEPVAPLTSRHERRSSKSDIMIAVLPGQPPTRLQGITTGFWDGRHQNAYISGSAFTILDGAYRILQTVYDDDNEQDLDAIAIDESSGKIATCTAKQVRIYRPLVLQDDNRKWAQQSCFDIPCPTPKATCALSWGGSEELLVASNALSLFATASFPANTWQRVLPNPVKYAIISHDSAYIASIGQHDCLTKVWRRLVYGADEVRFDVTYLRHPDIVVSMRWRRPRHSDQSVDNVLYTTCLDNSVRVWTPTEATEGRHWQLLGRVDLNEPAIDVPVRPHPPLIFIVDGCEFTAAMEKAVKARAADGPSTDDATIGHLAAVANKSPEICVKIDKFGNISAWALENVGNSKTEEFSVFSVAQLKLSHFEIVDDFLSGQEVAGHTEVQNYCDRSSGRLHIMLHSFDGKIGVFAGNLVDLLDPKNNDRRLDLQTVWTGHTAPIKKIVRNFSGHAVVSRTASGECILWCHSTLGGVHGDQTLIRRSVIPESGHIHRICVLRKGRFVVLLYHGAIVVWDCRNSIASRLAERSFDIQETPLCLIVLPPPRNTDYTLAYIATITSSGRGIVWEIRLPQYLSNDTTNKDTIGLSEFCRFELATPDGLKYVLPVDPAGAAPATSGFLDIFARDLAISYTRAGRVNFWTARVNLESRAVDWLSTSCTETGLLDPALASGSMLKKAALVNLTRSQLTIWDIGGSRLEYDMDYKAHHSIQDLDWTSTPDAQAILAVGFQHRVVLLSQMRFDYLNKGPAWAPIHEIDIRDLTAHPIGDSTWLADGHLVIAAGNQLFVYDRRMDTEDSSITPISHLNKDHRRDLFEVVQRFNGPIPIFHPQFLSQCILSGKGPIVRRILLALYKTLRYLIPGDTIDDYLGLPLSEFYTENTSQISSSGKAKGTSFLDDNECEEDDVFSAQTATYINEALTKIRIPQLTGHEQIQLADIIECAAVVESHRRSIDENGARFMLFFRQHALRKGRMNDMHLSWREINWAFHSSSQDILLDFVSRQNHRAMLWEPARECGVFMWLSDLTLLRDQFEVVARNEYTKNELKDPVDCSLFYLALRKKTILQGLWRMASWNEEQVATQKLLANNFDDPKWRRTALKNAYALLSKRRFHYAAAFFLLGGRLEDAVEVCLRQIKDLQLAIAICRVYEGDNGLVLRKLIQDEVLPLAAQEGNRWLASWGFWMLGRKDMAVRALIMPVFALLETPCSPDIKSRFFLTDDPALVVLYSQLRQQTLQTLRGASKVTPKVEWEFVLHSAKTYDRMGCDLLGLDLVRNWEFQQPATSGFGGEVNPLKLLRRRSSLVVDDLSAARRSLGLERTRDLTIDGPSKSSPSTFVEPEASSLLDSFGL
ncbi:WD repeat protein [Metarhizium album ARSEF 1941]|uniref:WD repeat protein n=1 Tax=Metarhizium album (strain ARSEF 1941) TaxID=1081103 RepID=A0A0B2WTA0_METAS|nr:WD repeat protein [Metarhizium album ARSEF 1941]KHN99271.1 WD repeat protein [Metarhizium album ARSEF 1941]